MRSCNPISIEDPTLRYLLGSLLILVGVGVIILRDHIRMLRDDLNESLPTLRGLMGDWWTGEYTRGGLLFVRAVIIVIGLILVAAGVGIMLT